MIYKIFKKFIDAEINRQKKEIAMTNYKKGMEDGKRFVAQIKNTIIEKEND